MPIYCWSPQECSLGTRELSKPPLLASEPLPGHSRLPHFLCLLLLPLPSLPFWSNIGQWPLHLPSPIFQCLAFSHTESRKNSCPSSTHLAFASPHSSSSLTLGSSKKLSGANLKNVMVSSNPSPPKHDPLSYSHLTYP